MKRALEISKLKIGYFKKKGHTIKVAGPIDVSIEQGELICLLGPNGVGKTTLLKTLAGIQNPLEGSISIMSQNLFSIDKKKLAKLLSIVLTEQVGYGNFTSRELIALGRIPYTGWLGSLNEHDKKIVQWAISSTNIGHLVNKSIHELSDGERQKVMIARALAQDTPVILLDEPTAHLDIPNRIDIIRLLRKLARETGKAIIMSTHELDLALQAADKIWLMTMENITFSGVPEDLVLNDVFGNAFTKEGITYDKNHGIFKVIEPHRSKVAVVGDDPGVFWTKRALERLGFAIISDEGYCDKISVELLDDNWYWNYSTVKENYVCESMAELIAFLKRKENKNE